MKALSLRQPWAWLVVHGGKKIENRRWRTHFRGTFLVHAAKGMTWNEYAEAVEFTQATDPNVVVPKFDALERGGIVGRARLVSVIEPCVVADPEAYLFAMCDHPWHMPGQFGFVLADVAPLPFVKMSGALGFFDVPARVVDGTITGAP